MSKLSKQAARDLPAEAEHAERLRTERGHEREINTLKDKLIRSEQRRKQAETDLEEAAEFGEIWAALGGDGGRVYPPFIFKKPAGTATAIVCINDLHCEETVEPGPINGLNTYNLDVSARRLGCVSKNVLTLLESNRKLSNIKDLAVWWGGDLITGHIHEELAEGNSLSPIEACEWAKHQLIGQIDYWLEHADVKSLTVVTSYGNHGRTTKKPRIATAAKHSFEWWMYHNIADIYRARGESRVQFKIEPGYFNWLDVQGKRVRFHHGDWIKYQGGVGGISIPVNKAINEWNKSERADFDIFGHWHQHLKSRRWCACNCLIGYNAYAQSIKAEFSDPTQTLLVFDAKRPVPVSVQEVFCD